jgi:hypothetical protein
MLIPHLHYKKRGFMNILLTVTFILSFSFTSNASDSWDSCTSADGSFQISYGELVLPEKGPEENYVLGKLVKSVLLKTRFEKCMLENSKYEVVALDEETTYEVYEMSVGESGPFEVEFLCNRGGSGIPAADWCKPGPSKIKETYYVK